MKPVRGVNVPPHYRDNERTRPRRREVRHTVKGNCLPRYLIERSIGTLTRQELFEAGRRSASVLADMPDVRWIRSYVSEVEGKMYCEYDAPGIEAIRDHARRAGIGADRITELTLELSPLMFV